MGFESFHAKYEPRDYRVYSLGYDWNRRPEILIPTMQRNIDYAFKRLNIDRDFNAIFTFRVPDQTHVLPLFQNILFHALVEFHNKNSDENGHVNPLILMLFDPILSSIIKEVKSKRGTFVNLHGEDAIQHELAHFLALQDLWKSGAKGEIQFEFFWRKNKKRYELIAEGGFSSDENPNDKDDLYTFKGPLFSSSVDLKNIRKFLLKDRKVSNLFDLLSFNLSKLLDQGSTRFNPLRLQPLSTDEMLKLLLYEWRKKRESLIDFKIWERLEI